MLPDYLWENYFFGNLLITFQHYYYVKYIFLVPLL